MAIFWRDGLKGRWFVIVFSDPYSADEGDRVMTEILARPGNVMPLRFLVDARHSAPPPAAFVRHAIAFWATQIEKMRGARIAIVVASDAQYGMARMAELSTEVSQLPLAVRAFRQWDDAERWLEELRDNGGSGTV